MNRIPATLAAALLAAMLASCEAQKPEDVPPPPPSPAEPAGVPPGEYPPAGEGAPATDPATAPEHPASAPADPATAPPAPTQPAPTAPPPSEPSPAPTPTASRLPAVESMSLAKPPAKLGVAVDLRYQFGSAVVDDRPVTLHLAVIPRVAGTNFKVSVKKVEGLEVSNGSLALQKVDAAGIYRQELSVIRRASAPAGIRVLVTMDVPEGAGFGFFTIPLEGGTSPQKSDSVKQR
jgi:hypothetical protein